MESLWLGARGGPILSAPGGVCVENSKENAIKRASATATSPKRPFGVMTVRSVAVSGDTALGGRANMSVWGRSATSSPAIASTGRPDGSPSGKAAISPQSRGRRLALRHPRETDGLQPRIEIGPPQHRNDAEQLTVPIFAYRGEQERIELAPNVRRQRGVGHFVNRFCMAPTPNGAWATFFVLGGGEADCDSQAR